MLPPYFAGAARSRLPKMLEDGHGDTKLTRAERETIACWIDLAVPFCGDYTEAAAWTEAEQAKYANYLDKRRRMEAQERVNIEEYMRERAMAR